MTDAKRIDEFLERLGKVWKENPDKRFMQLVFDTFDGQYDYMRSDDNAIKYIEMKNSK